LALAALVFALAGPYRPETTVERVGQGAEIVLVLDRSRSMDQGFAPLRGELTAFFGRSREAFFALDGAAPRDPAWLIEFCRRCRNVERGAA
jgi:hypothetical protein